MEIKAVFCQVYEWLVTAEGFGLTFECVNLLFHMRPRLRIHLVTDYYQRLVFVFVCNFSGGVMIYFDRVEVVNVLSASAGQTG